MRDGVQVRIARRDVVRGDDALLAEGDRVPADAVLLDSMNFSVDESALTGESVPVRKVPVETESVSAPLGRPGDDATPWVFSGTLVVKGHGLALVKETGSGTSSAGSGGPCERSSRSGLPSGGRSTGWCVPWPCWASVPPSWQSSTG